LYYDKEDPLDIERYAKQIIGKDFREILRASYVAETDAKLVLNKSKGNLGEIIEEYHFYYKPNSNSAPDFKDANVELKVTPYKRNLNGTFSSKERLVLNIINYLNIIQEKFKSSTLLSKNSTLLLIFYLWEREIYQLDYKIDYAGLYNFPPEDLLIIEQDWNIIVSKIKDGKAHELSESDTTYLSASTKGSTAEKSFREQPNSASRAKQRAFSLKASYMTVVLNKFINKEITYEPIIKNIMQLENETLEECITKKFKINYGLNINLKHIMVMQSVCFNISWGKGNFTCLAVVFNLRRRLGYHLFHTYIPSGIVSQKHVK
jgi:DNA mismatch repair protein MutH